MPYMIRLEKAKELVTEAGLDALLICDPANLFYFSGYNTLPHATCRLLVPAEGRPLFFAPGVDITGARQHFERARADVDVRHVRVGEKMDDVIFSAIEELGVAKLGFDALPLATYKRLAGKLGPEALSDLSERIWELRKVKDEREIACIRRACEIASKALERARELLEPGLTEIEVAGELERELRRLGSERHPFDIIVASGPNAALPHARTSARELRPGEPVIIDLGAVHEGYVSDMTRTFLVPGGKASEELKRAYRVAREAQAAAIEAIRAGVRACEIDEIAREIVRKEGFGDLFVHSLGHGVGVVVHELPRLGPGVEEELKTGYVVTVEPGIYKPGEWGVRVEDVVLVLEDGAEVLTGPRAPEELGAA